MILNRIGAEELRSRNDRPAAALYVYAVPMTPGTNAVEYGILLDELRLDVPIELVRDVVVEAGQKLTEIVDDLKKKEQEP